MIIFQELLEYFTNVILCDLLAAITNPLITLEARGLKSKCPFTNGNL